MFAEIDLVSSHSPWTRIPKLIPRDDLGDGSIFDHPPVQKTNGEQARLRPLDRIHDELDRLVRATLGDENLVLIALGDHQPASVVTGQGASHDVPISIIAHDPKVLAGSPAGAGRPACSRTRTRRSGRWLRSAIASWTRSLPMNQDVRAPFEEALHRARVSAYAPGAFVGQEAS